ncbi:signal peptidase I [Tumebacillus avium]|nr:signal peptidase I [Tumebacillus avium]
MTEFDWKEALSKPPVEHSQAGFTDELRQKIHTQAASGARKSPRRVGAWLCGGVAVAAIAFALWQTPTLWQALNAPETITDPITAVHLPDMAQTESNLPAYPVGNREAIFDETYQTAASLQRGDLILYSTPRKAFEKYPEYTEPNHYKAVHRVIGLPGETVEIRDAQFYIDGKKLDTFYGSFHDPNETPEPDDLYLAPVKVPDGHVFVIGDTWSISAMDSRHYGPLSETDIIGKVIGYRI